MELIPDVDGSCVEDVRSDAASVDKAAERAGFESFEVGARFGAALSEAFDLADPERLPDERVEVDASGDDVASSLLRCDRDASRCEFVERFGFDQGEILADTAEDRSRRFRSRPGIGRRRCRRDAQ